MSEFTEVLPGKLNIQNIKKYAPFIAGGAILGLIAYFTKSSSSSTLNEESLGDITKQSEIPVATASADAENSKSQAEMASLFASAITETYKQSQSNLNTALTEFRSNDASVAKQLLDLENKLQADFAAQQQSINTSLATYAVQAAKQNVAQQVASVQQNSNSRYVTSQTPYYGDDVSGGYNDNSYSNSDGAGSKGSDGSYTTPSTPETATAVNNPYNANISTGDYTYNGVDYSGYTGAEDQIGTPMEAAYWNNFINS